MAETRFVALTIVAVALLLALSRLTKIPPSIALFTGGLASILLPGPLPALRVDPLIVLGLILPPLLYAGITNIPAELLHRAAWRGVLGGALWTLGLTTACGFAATLLLPGLDPVACMAIGVAAAIAEPRVLLETGLNKRMPPAISEAMSAQLVSAPLLGVSLSIFTAKQVGGPFPGFTAIAQTLAYDTVIGGAAGIALGFAMAALRRRLNNPRTETALSLATPFAAGALGEAIGASPVAPLIGAGVTMAYIHTNKTTGESIASPESHQLTEDLWQALGAILTGALFFLMGRALPEALAGARALPWTTLATAAAALMALCWAVQFTLSWAALAHPNSPPIPREDGGRVPPWQGAALMAGGAGRNVVALAVALALPATLPGGGEPYLPRDAVVAVVALMVVASAGLQWVGVPGLVRWVRPGKAG